MSSKYQNKQQKKKAQDTKSRTKVYLCKACGVQATKPRAGEAIEGKKDGVTGLGKWSCPNKCAKPIKVTVQSKKQEEEVAA